MNKFNRIKKCFSNMKSYFSILLLVLAFASCTVDPSEKGFYKLSDSKKFLFNENGTVETWDAGTEYWDTSCRTKGRWKLDGNIVVITGLFNSNCPWIKDRNGRYKLDGDYLVRQ